MHRQHYIILAGLVALLVACFITALQTPTEPSWEGQPLSYWLQIGYGSGMTHGDNDRDNADAAVRHMGASALPFLILELGAKHSHIRWRLVRLLRNQSVVSITYRYPDERRTRAIGAFQALGKVAIPALPLIRRYLADAELQNDAQTAIDAILAIDHSEPVVKQ